MIEKPKRPRSKQRVPIPPQKNRAAYRQLWKVIDGAVMDCFNHHQDYLTAKGMNHNAARRSIVKRVVGAVLSFAENSEGST